MVGCVVCRFRQYEDDAGSAAPAERKPVRRITPPRDEVALHTQHVVAERGDVVRSGEPLNPEEELPPAEYTRSMLAKFRYSSPA